MNNLKALSDGELQAQLKAARADIETCDKAMLYVGITAEQLGKLEYIRGVNVTIAKRLEKEIARRKAKRERRR
jgi:hypothetical protein